MRRSRRFHLESTLSRNDPTASQSRRGLGHAAAVPERQTMPAGDSQTVRCTSGTAHFKNKGPRNYLRVTAGSGQEQSVIAAPQFAAKQSFVGRVASLPRSPKCWQRRSGQLSSSITQRLRTFLM